jgi:hypothetical protein
MGRVIFEEYGDSTQDIPQPVFGLFGKNLRMPTSWPSVPQRLRPEGEALLQEYEQALMSLLDQHNQAHTQEAAALRAASPPSPPPPTSRQARSGATRGRKKRGKKRGG